MAGPSRYVNSVTERLNNIFEPRLEYDFFYFIWDDDLGNKKRRDEEKYYNDIIKSNKTKCFILNKSYTAEEIQKLTKFEQDNSHSTINAMIGMFTSMNILCHHLMLLPDSLEYTHILRIRTDCLILDNNFLHDSLFKKNNVLVSKNYVIPDSWISDHIMFAKKDLFLKFWKHKNVYEIIDLYKKGEMNPERTLSYIAKINYLDVQAIFTRYVDYHIVYNPAKENEPESLNAYLNKNDNLRELFINHNKYLVKDEFTAMSNSLKQNISNLNEAFRKKSLLERIKNKVKRFLK